MGQPRGTILVEVELSGPGNRMLRRGQQVGSQERRQQKGEGDLVLLGEERWCLPPPGVAGAVSQEEGASGRWLLSFALPIRFLSLGSTRIPGTENGARCLHQCLREEGGGEG